MKDRNTILAHLLAAEEHPPLQDESAFQEARQAMEADPDIQKAYEESKAFFNRHPVLIDTGTMPEDVRKRIEKSLEKSVSLLSSKVTMELSPWTIRTQFAWAALLVLLLAGMSVLSSYIMDVQHEKERQTAYIQQPPQDAFRSYVGQMVMNIPVLEERNQDPKELLNWVREHGMQQTSPPTALMNREGIGCANLEGPNGPISLICFKVDGQVVHLFVAENTSLHLSRTQPPQPMQIQQRDALQWTDEAHTYLMISHDKNQKLPEVFL